MRGSGAAQTGRPTTMWSAPSADRLRRGRDALLVALGRPRRTDAGGDDQPALRLRQGADQGGFLRAGDDAMRPGLEARGRRVPR